MSDFGRGSTQLAGPARLATGTVHAIELNPILGKLEERLLAAELAAFDDTVDAPLAATGWSQSNISTTFITLGSLTIPERLEDEVWILGYSVFVAGGTGVGEARILFPGSVVLDGSRVRAAETAGEGGTASMAQSYLITAGASFSASIQVRVTAGNTGQTFNDPGTNRFFAQRLQGARGPQGAMGPTGPQGATGTTGAPGADGEGVPTGGTTGQALVKASNANFDTTWANVQPEVATFRAARYSAANSRYELVDAAGATSGTALPGPGSRDYLAWVVRDTAAGDPLPSLGEMDHLLVI